MRNVQIFEERGYEKGFSSLVKDVHKFAEELGTSLNLATPNPSCSLKQAPEKRISRHQVIQHLKKAVKEKLKEKVEDKRRQRCLLWTRKDDDQLSEHGYFAWLNKCTCTPTHIITGVMGP